MSTRWMPEDYSRRPRDFDPLLADQIVEMIANGDTLISICQNDPNLPMPATFLKWVDQDPALAESYADAQRMRTEIFVEEMVEVGDGHDAARARVQVATRQFHAERLMPAKYSPRAYVHNPKPEGEDRGGIDYGADVRRKLAEMAKRRDAEAASTAEAGQD